VGVCPSYNWNQRDGATAKKMCSKCADCMGVYQYGGSNGRWAYCSKSQPAYYRGKWNGYRAYYILDNTDSNFYCKKGQSYTPTGNDANQCTPSTTSPGDGARLCT